MGGKSRGRGVGRVEGRKGRADKDRRGKRRRKSKKQGRKGKLKIEVL